MTSRRGARNRDQLAPADVWRRIAHELCERLLVHRQPVTVTSNVRAAFATVDSPRVAA